MVLNNVSEHSGAPVSSPIASITHTSAPFCAPKRIILVACAASKLDRSVQARDLYMPSAWFRKARRYAEDEVDAGAAAAWFILSAKHQLLRPDQEISPYELSLRDMHRDYRESWGNLTAIGLTEAITGKAYPGVGEAPLRGFITELIAGEVYVTPLRPFLRGFGAVVETPVKGMGIGVQMAWLQRQCIDRAFDRTRDALRRAAA